MSFSVNVKMSGAGETFSVEVSNETTVGEMKEKCTTVKTDLEVPRITLVYKGRILKDEQTVEEIKLVEGQTIHLVNKPAKKPAAKQPAAKKPAAAKPKTTQAPKKASKVAAKAAPKKAPKKTAKKAAKKAPVKTFSPTFAPSCSKTS